MSRVINGTHAASQEYKYFKFDLACYAYFKRNYQDQQLNRIADTQPGYLSNHPKVEHDTEGPPPINNIKEA